MLQITSNIYQKIRLINLTQKVSLTYFLRFSDAFSST